MSIKIGPDNENPGAVIRWGEHWDNGFWVTWKHWKNREFLYRFKMLKGYLAISLFTFRWGNKYE